MKFSERIGKKPAKTVLQVDTMDSSLRNGLWNAVLEEFMNKLTDWVPEHREPPLSLVSKYIWKEFFKKPIDQIPVYDSDGYVRKASFISFVRDWFFKVEWFEIYDFIEFISQFEKRIQSSNLSNECNRILKNEIAGYRIINERIVQITSEEEIQSIEDASDLTSEWHSVNTHLKSALDSLADRANPNYRNSIKESISAVESFCKIITSDQDATLGKALAEIEKKHKLHGALKSAFSSIYGYTSDSGGIRHALLESDSVVEFEDAKFMLVACSAFINYLKVKIQ